jgi:acetoin utilization deacetylase AcuC-like enzyme
MGRAEDVKPRVALVTSSAYFRHETGPHPENAERLRAVYRYLQETGLAARLPAVPPRPATDEELLAVHTARHVEMLSQLSRRGGGWIDADTAVSPATDEVARLAAGGALAVLDAVISREPSRPTTAFVLARPPGHHAMAERAMGFCLYNSIAVAARYAQRRHGVRRVLVLDWDVHHGNGTQDLFYDDPSVLFISLHQYPLWPPGWGWLDQVGSGAGRGFSVNVPLPPGEGDGGYALACERVVRPIATAFQPELVLVSAGQDGHIADPISSMALTAGGFAALARLARGIAASAGAYGPVLLLEGGYNPTTLPYLVAAILDALGDLDLAVSDPYARHVPVSDEALRRLQAVADTLRPWWTLSQQ